jgi:putative addiction module component (TIGR02574 family)
MKRTKTALVNGWADDIDRANPQPDLSDRLREELDRRIAEDDADPEAGSPWPEVKRRILSSL